MPYSEKKPNLLFAEQVRFFCLRRLCLLEEGFFQVFKHVVKGGNAAFGCVPHIRMLKVYDIAVFESAGGFDKVVFNHFLCRGGTFGANGGVAVHYKYVVLADEVVRFLVFHTCNFFA